MRSDISFRQGFWIIFLMGSGALGYLGYNAHDLFVRYQQYTDQTNQQVEESSSDESTKPGIQQPTTDYTVRLLADDQYYEVVRSLIQSAQQRVFVAMYLMYAPTLVEGDRAPPTDKVMEVGAHNWTNGAFHNNKETSLWLEPEDGQNWSWSRYRKALVAPKTTSGTDP